MVSAAPLPPATISDERLNWAWNGFASAAAWIDGELLGRNDDVSVLTTLEIEGPSAVASTVAAIQRTTIR